MDRGVSGTKSLRWFAWFTFQIIIQNRINRKKNNTEICPTATVRIKHTRIGERENRFV